MAWILGQSWEQEGHTGGRVGRGRCVYTGLTQTKEPGWKTGYKQLRVVVVVIAEFLRPETATESSVSA